LKSSSPRPHRLHAAARAALGLGAVLILVSSCTSSSDEGRQAGVLGTRVCVKSQSPAILYVTFDLKDTSTGEGQLTSGAQACAEGSSAGLALDVSGKIQIQGTPIRELSLYAQNIWIGAPMAYLKQGKPVDRYCTSYDGMAINEVRTWDDGLQRFVVTRRADGQWKEFTVEVFETQDPSPDGTARPCTRK
jgi:hypothetical protein